MSCAPCSCPGFSPDASRNIPGTISPAEFPPATQNRSPFPPAAASFRMRGEATPSEFDCHQLISRIAKKCVQIRSRCPAEPQHGRHCPNRRNAVWICPPNQVFRANLPAILYATGEPCSVLILPSFPAIDGRSECRRILKSVNTKGYRQRNGPVPVKRDTTCASAAIFCRFYGKIQSKPKSFRTG